MYSAYIGPWDPADEVFVRDDLTVEVIFFGDGDGVKSGDVLPNPEATASLAGVKAKL